MAPPTHGPAEERLFAIEERFWTAGADFYRTNLTPGFLMVFPTLGALDRDSTIEGIAGGRRWSTLQMTERRMTALNETTAILSYHATAQREGDTPYTALVSSVYVEENGEWKLAFHHQTPLATE